MACAVRMLLCHRVLLLTLAACLPGGLTIRQGDSDDALSTEESDDDSLSANYDYEPHIGEAIGAAVHNEPVMYDKEVLAKIQEEMLEKPLSEPNVFWAFKLADKDGDGLISLSEILDKSHYHRQQRALTSVRQQVEALDSDGDQKLTLEEALQHLQRLPLDSEHAAKEHAFEMKKFQLSDSDGDMLLAFEELLSFFDPAWNDEVLTHRTNATMHRMDLDSDGKLSLYEFVSNGMPLDMPAEGLRSMTFELLDDDESGTLDKDELRHFESGAHHTDAQIQTLFKVVDKDKDRKISLEELRNARHDLPETGAQRLVEEWLVKQEL
eukprot:TRINITY_DN94660_c0_g1_i1.p1 TRINITY_DN94660_c0_g1~~TRINITY_DN94660_c0_g1_i1.p1  ORF type:complete len:333 (-),score=87.06 TRINITY_DN94660_c0_g1_i1:159-1127(-)